MKILLIDETVGYLHPLSEALNGVGYEVVLAKEGGTAPSLAKAHQPDLIVIDTTSPEPSDQVVQELLEAGEHAPVLILSELDSPLLKETAFLCGCIDFISRGMGRDRILERVKQSCTLGAIERGVKGLTKRVA